MSRGTKTFACHRISQQLHYTIKYAFSEWDTISNVFNPPPSKSCPQWNNNSKTMGKWEKIITDSWVRLGSPMEDSSSSPSQMLKGRYAWWMESLTSSRSGMMARHLSEVLHSHCDQILLCPCFIVVTAWGMLGFVLPTVAIHHLWRKRTRAQWHFAFYLQQPPSHTHTCTLPHTHTHLSLHTPLSFSVLRHPVFATEPAPAFSSTHVLLNYLSCFSHTPHSIPVELSLRGAWEDRRGRYVLQLYSETLSS